MSSGKECETLRGPCSVIFVVFASNQVPASGGPQHRSCPGEDIAQGGGLAMNSANNECSEVCQIMSTNTVIYPYPYHHCFLTSMPKRWWCKPVTGNKRLCSSRTPLDFSVANTCSPVNLLVLSFYFAGMWVAIIRLVH